MTTMGDVVSLPAHACLVGHERKNANDVHGNTTPPHIVGIGIITIELIIGYLNPDTPDEGWESRKH